MENNSPPSPTNSQKTISDDDEIDYSIKPEFYDPDLDTKDEIWVQKRKRKGKNSTSDAVLSCPACFTTLCFESQRHEQFLTQYRAVFVVNCKINLNNQVPLRSPTLVGDGNHRRKRKSGMDVGVAVVEQEEEGERLKSVCCDVCSTEVGAMDEDEVYHFFNVIPSEG